MPTPIPLVCTQCGAEIEVERTFIDTGLFKLTSDGTKVKFAGNQIITTLECAHCHTKFDPGTEFTTTAPLDTLIVNSGDGAVANGPGAIAAGKYGVAIKGNVGTVVIGDDNTITQHFG